MECLIRLNCSNSKIPKEWHWTSCSPQLTTQASVKPALVDCYLNPWSPLLACLSPNNKDTTHFYESRWALFVGPVLLKICQWCGNRHANILFFFFLLLSRNVLRILFKYWSKSFNECKQFQGFLWNPLFEFNKFIRIMLHGDRERKWILNSKDMDFM